MEKVREIIRLKEQCGLSERAISRALRVSRPVVKDYFCKLQSAGLDYAAIKEMNDDTLLQVIEGRRQVTSERYQALRRKFGYFVKELKRPGVTRERLWQEYRAEHPDSYGYSQFCYHFQLWRSTSELTMHMNHKAGDKMFVDELDLVAAVTIGNAVVVFVITEIDVVVELNLERLEFSDDIFLLW